MPSKNTISFRITKETRSELDNIRKSVAIKNKIPEEEITLIDCEVILREKSKAGFISQQRVLEILAGKR